MAYKNSAVYIDKQETLEQKFQLVWEFLRTDENDNLIPNSNDSFSRLMETLGTSSIWSSDLKDKQIQSILTYCLMLLSHPDIQDAKRIEGDILFAETLCQQSTHLSVRLSTLTDLLCKENKTQLDKRISFDFLLNYLDSSITRSDKDSCRILSLLSEMYDAIDRHDIALKCKLQIISLDLPDLKDETIDAILLNIADPEIFELDHLLMHEQVRLLEGELSYKILSAFINGDVKEFKKLWLTAAENTRIRDAIARNGISYDVCTNKILIIAFLQLCESCPAKSLTFDEIKETLSLETDEDVEDIAVKVVKLKLARCTVDVAKRSVHVQGAIPVIFGDSSWNAVQEIVNDWRSGSAGAA
ncbi:hypothetical protein ACOME3_008466 [Neoechinorhynchus agilis]